MRCVTEEVDGPHGSKFVLQSCASFAHPRLSRPSAPNARGSAGEAAALHNSVAETMRLLGQAPSWLSEGLSNVVRHQELEFTWKRIMRVFVRYAPQALQAECNLIN